MTALVTDEVYRERAGALANMLADNGYRHGQGSWGKPEESNPCGTTACAAGWATLAKHGIVTIAPDGTMTYDPKNLGPVAPYGSRYRSGFLADELAVGTLWRARFDDVAEDEGRIWLGLSYTVTKALFHMTNFCADPEAAAVAVLRRLADGRLDRSSDDYVSASDMSAMAREDLLAAQS